ncbi:MAG TPA: glucose dehydrogenase, partial [Planctomycetaceae bacterium]|nr:glucose dehydrogenase [Planctomycetaceae bacterium]
MRIFVLLLVCLIEIAYLQTVRAERVPNQLTRAEEISGWQSLFDGKTADSFRNYRKQTLNPGWQVIDGALTRAAARAGDIITKEQYRYFELSIEFKIAKGGNSGIMFHVEEGPGFAWFTGPEVQVLCNEAGKDEQKAGWLNQLYSPRKEAGRPVAATRPAGQWNHIYLRVSPLGCEVCMNGVRYYTFSLGDKSWEKRVAESKFAKQAKFGKAGQGHICLQDHGDQVAGRNIKIRKLAEDGTLPRAPVDGTLEIQGVPAFPDLQWEGYHPVDQDGNVAKQLRIRELTTARDVPGRLFAAAQSGVIYSFENQPDVQQARVLLDLSGRVRRWWDNGGNNEQGLLGVAMHPQFSKNGQFFVSYNHIDDNRTVISRFQISSSDPLKADPDSEQIVLEVPQPFTNHNGGAIEFGPDGHLYIALGDGGLRNDTQENGENLGTLLGSILRIDVDHPVKGKNYGIPADNPFVSVTGAQPEIFAFGLRNTWRIAFDRATGLLWCGDVGQELWEEIDVIEKGRNYGWSSREGSKPFSNRSGHPDFPHT